MGGKSKPPPAPDYAAAAQQTADGNLDVARLTTKANRVSQYTPYGNLIYQNGVNGDQDQWNATVQLSPEQQAILDQQNKISLGLGSTMNKGLGYVQGMLDKPFDQSALPQQMVNAGQTGQDALMARINPQFEQREDQLRTQMANQGISAGSEAWNRGMDDLNRSRNDATTQAALQGINLGNNARQQAIQEQSFFRNEPLNTLNAVRTGAQVTNPSFTNTPQQQYTPGPDMLGAANAQYGSAMDAYNAQQAQSGGLMSGLFGLGSSALGSGWIGGLF